MLRSAVRQTYRSVGFLRALIPTAAWTKSAALRLGTFIMSYFASVAAIVILFAAAGIA